MIQLLCPKCSALLQVPENAAGQQARCPRCSETTPIPIPGESHRKQHCLDCGHNADYTTEGPCPSCGQTHWAGWCGKHERQLVGQVCPSCVDDQNKAAAEPAPSAAPYDLAQEEEPARGPVPPAGPGMGPPPPPPGGGSVDPYRPPTAGPAYAPAEGYGLPTSGAAMGAMICGITGLVGSCLCPCLGLILNGVAIGLAFQANAEIARGAVLPSEKSKVVTAWVCGGIGLLIAVLNAILGVMMQLGHINLQNF